MTIIFRYITAIAWFVQFKDVEMKTQMSTERPLFIDIPMIFPLDSWERKSLASWSELIKKTDFPRKIFIGCCSFTQSFVWERKTPYGLIHWDNRPINLENIKSIWSLRRDERQAFQGIMARLDRYHHSILIDEEMLLQCREKERTLFLQFWSTNC